MACLVQGSSVLVASNGRAAGVNGLRAPRTPLPPAAGLGPAPRHRKSQLAMTAVAHSRASSNDGSILSAVDELPDGSVLLHFAPEDSPDSPEQERQVVTFLTKPVEGQKHRRVPTEVLEQVLGSHYHGYGNPGYGIKSLVKGVLAPPTANGALTKATHHAPPPAAPKTVARPEALAQTREAPVPASPPATAEVAERAIKPEKPVSLPALAQVAAPLQTQAFEPKTGATEEVPWVPAVGPQSAGTRAVVPQSAVPQAAAPQAAAPQATAPQAAAPHAAAPQAAELQAAAPLAAAPQAVAPQGSASALRHVEETDSMKPESRGRPAPAGASPRRLDAVRVTAVFLAAAVTTSILRALVALSSFGSGISLQPPAYTVATVAAFALSYVVFWITGFAKAPAEGVAA